MILRCDRTGTLDDAHEPAPPVRQRAFHAFPPRCELELKAARAVVIEEAAAAWAAAPRRRERADWLRSPELHPGRVLAEAVAADRDWPPFRRAMRDGYALRAAEARPGQVLACAGQVRAGEEAPALMPGTCVEIMTGAMVPDGADTVVMIERTRRDAGGVYCDERPRAGDNIAAPGQEAAGGAVVATEGQRLTPATIAVLAQAGCLTPLVFARPRVAIVVTGDELTPPEQTPGPGQIRNSNGPMLAALARRAGAEVISSIPVGDDATAVRRGLEQSWAAADIVICSGGVSVGAHDHIQPVLNAMGVEPRFDAVSIRPGRPQVFARRGGRLLFGLPGNPVGALLGFLLLARPAIEVLGGVAAATAGTAFRDAVLGFDYQGKRLPMALFRPVRFAEGSGAAAPRVEAVEFQGAADVAAAARADAWLLVPPLVTSIAAGTPVLVVMA